MNPVRPASTSGTMSTVVPIAIPRWQWRIFATDLGWLARRLEPGLRGPGRRLEETHLVCSHSSHHAWLEGERLEMRWRKEVAPEGFELWDAILRATAPFGRGDVARLYAAWGLAEPVLSGDVDVASFLGQVIAATPAVRAVCVERRCQGIYLHGVAGSLEAIEVSPSVRLESVSLEHEDPSILAQLLREVGCAPHDNQSFLRGLKGALGLANAPQ